ncbi:MAG: DMT family transporter [Myxococcales bacterium]|nr:DMT family transporter [Myxococcales bacterium]
MKPAREAWSTRWGPDAALLFITAVWGATFVTVKRALEDADTFTFLALRFGLGAVAAACLAGGALRSRAAWRGGVVLGVLLFGGYALQTWGLSLTTPSRSAFLTGLTVVFVPFAQLAIFRGRPGGWALGGVVLAVVGLALLTGVEFRSGLPAGDLLTLGCAVVYAFHIALTGKYARQAPPTALVTVQLIVTAGLAAVCMPLGPMRLHSTAGFWGAVVVTGVVASAVAISLQAWAQAKASPVRAALIFSLEPVFAAGLSAGLGQERLSGREVMGGAVIILGVVVGEVGAAWQRADRGSGGSE